MKLFRLLAATLLAVAASGASAVEYRGEMKGGDRLLPGDYFVSFDGTYLLEMKRDGSIARRGPKGEFWNPGKFGHELVFQTDGNLVLYDLNRSGVIWTIDQGIIAPQTTTLSILNNGEMYATDAANHIIWRLPKDPNYVDNPLPTNCPGGGKPQPYPACANAGTSFQFDIPIPACSPAEAAIIARQSGFTPGRCR